MKQVNIFPYLLDKVLRCKNIQLNRLKNIILDLEKVTIFHYMHRF